MARRDATVFDTFIRHRPDSDAMGRAGIRGERGAVSRRRGSPEAETAPRKLPIERRQIVTGAVALAILILVFMVTQRDGGAPQQNTFAAQSHAAVVSWRYVTDGVDGVRTLCSDGTEPCDPEELWALREANATCDLHARFWLADRQMPIVLRDVQARANGTAWAGDYTLTNDTSGTPINLTTTYFDKALDWDNGWWWRIESEYVGVRVGFPCDTHSASFVLGVTGKHLDGEGWSDTQGAQVNMHDAYLSRLGQVPRTQPFG